MQNILSSKAFAEHNQKLKFNVTYEIRTNDFYKAAANEEIIDMYESTVQIPQITLIILYSGDSGNEFPLFLTGRNSLSLFF